MESHQRLGFQRNARHESRLSPTKDSINKITWKRIFVKTRDKVTLKKQGKLEEIRGKFPLFFVQIFTLCTGF